MTKPTLTTITGPSGSGKTELLNILCAQHNFAKLVSVTTRAPRPGEQEGKDYYFITEDAFKALQADGQLVQEVSFNGAWYGTTKTELDRIVRDGKMPAVIVEPGGVVQFASICDTLGCKLFTVFVDADLPQLVERFLGRMVGETISAERAEYYTKRLVSLYDESQNWSQGLTYHLYVINTGALEKLTSWASSTAEYIKEINKQEEE